MLSYVLEHSVRCLLHFQIFWPSFSPRWSDLTSETTPWTGPSLRAASVGWTSTPRRSVASGSPSFSSSGSWSSWWPVRRSGVTSKRTLIAIPNNPVVTMSATTISSPSPTPDSGLSSWSLSPARPFSWRSMCPTGKNASANIGWSTERTVPLCTITQARSEEDFGGPTSWACCLRWRWMVCLFSSFSTSTRPHSSHHWWNATRSHVPMWWTATLQGKGTSNVLHC